MQWTVIGHEHQKEYFERVLRQAQDEARAYLFHGPQGVGKRMFADDLIRALLSGEREPEQNPDFMLVGPEVEQVRAMKRWAYLRPLYGARKVVLIDDAERMSDAAANTVLKVLEEPPEYLHFILITSQPKRMLGTIASRCQGVAFTVLISEEMQRVLKGLKLDADDKQLLATVAGGRPGEALRLVRENKLRTVAQSIADLEKALRADVAERLIYAKCVAEADDAASIVGWWLAWMHSQLAARPGQARVMHSLLDLHDAIRESKYNRRLAVEKFFLEV